MRDIKFRAYHQIHTKMRYFDKDELCRDIYLNSHLAKLMCGYSGDVLMQFIGLKDKNGVEIYEGDIVKCHWLAELGITEINCEHVGIVRFVDCRFVVSFDNPFIRNIGEDGAYSVTELELTMHSHDADCHLEYEVIGNIHEKPELLKV